MKNKLLEELYDIDPIYINEHLEWDKRSKNKRAMLYRIASVAACLVLMVTSICVLIPGGIFDAVLNKTQDGDYNDPHSVPTKIVYANNYEIKIDDNSSEIEKLPIEGVTFTGSLYNIINDKELYIDSTFAVNVSFSMEFKESEDYYALIAEAENIYESMWNRYYNEFQLHKLSVHNTEVMDWKCEDCLRYHSLHEQDEKKIDDLNREALNVREKDREKHDIKLREYGNSLIESMGLDCRFVTLNWINASDDVEPVVIQELIILHLTKEQLLNFKVPDGIGAEFTLLPEWVDCGESVIYRDYSLYPVELD